MSWMIANAENLKIGAQVRRNRGQATGKAAAGWNFKRRDPEKGSWDRSVMVAKAGWQAVRGEAVEQFRLAAFGDVFEGADPLDLFGF